MSDLGVTPTASRKAKPIITIERPGRGIRFDTAELGRPKHLKDRVTSQPEDDWFVQYVSAGKIPETDHCTVTSTSIDETPCSRRDVPAIESLNESIPRAPGFEK
jgi:hypothetical protein